MKRAPDLFHRVTDDDDGYRRVIINGTVRAMVYRNALDAPMLKLFRACGPWGAYALTAAQPQTTRGNSP